MTKALAALNHATSGGVYYTANIDFTDLATQPTWAKLGVTGLDNLLIKRMQNDFYTPYSDIYLQLDNDNIYHYNGATWDEILNLADALALVSWSAMGVLMGYIYTDKTVAGVIYVTLTKTVSGCRVLKSSDYGATWEVLIVGGVNNALISAGASQIQAVGNFIAVCIGAVYRGVVFSYDGGLNWAWNPVWSTSGGGAPAKMDRHDPWYVYYRKSATDADLLKISVGVELELQNGYSLAWSLADHEHTHWIDPVTAGHHRIVRSLLGNVAIFSTVDAWTNLVDSTPTNLLTSYTLFVGALAAALENNTFGMFGMTDVAVGGAVTGLVYGFVGDNPGSSTAISGTNYNTAPYTDAIPRVNGGYIASQGIFVGEAPASTGIEIYSVEHDGAYDVDHTPMTGDRSSWRDLPANQHDIKHAEDVKLLTPQIHAPWDEASPPPVGYGIVSDGSKWIVSTGVMRVGWYAQVVIVAKSGGQYTTIQAAINSIGDAAGDKRYLVWVMPGIYAEQVTMKDWVDVRGASKHTTVIEYGADAGALILSDWCQIEDLLFETTATATHWAIVGTNKSNWHIRNCDILSGSITNRSQGIKVTGATWHTGFIEHCVLNFYTQSGNGIYLSGNSTNIDTIINDVFCDTFGATTGGGINLLDAKDVQIRSSFFRTATAGYNVLADGTTDLDIFDSFLEFGTYSLEIGANAWVRTFNTFCQSIGSAGWLNPHANRRGVYQLSASDTLDIGADVVEVDATGGAVTLTLQPAAGNSGLAHTIKKVDASANQVIIDANGAELIDGDATAIIDTQWTSATIVCNGTGWSIV